MAASSSFTRGRCRRLFLIGCLAAVFVIVSTADIDQEDLVFDDLTSDFSNHHHWNRQSSRSISRSQDISPVDSPSYLPSSNKLEQSSGLLNTIQSGLKRFKRGFSDWLWPSDDNTKPPVEVTETTRLDRQTRSVDTEEFKKSEDDNTLHSDRYSNLPSDDEDDGGQSGDASGDIPFVVPIPGENRPSFAFYRITLGVTEPHRQEYDNPHSQLFKEFSKNFSAVVDHLYDDVPGTQTSEVIKIERLSDPFELKVTLDIVSDNPNSDRIKRQILEQIQNYHKIGNFTVSTQNFSFREASASPNSELKCEEGQIECSTVNGENCLPSEARCNGFEDCIDGRDEQGCPPITPEPRLVTIAPSQPALSVTNTSTPTAKRCRADDSVRCADGKSTICADEKCDGKPDCPDGDDENGCPNECAAGEYMCDVTRCIPEHNFCDGVKQCDDGTDERNCPPPHSCDPGQFLCDTRRCISEEERCNGVDDCSDKTDEMNCPPKSACSRDDFQCRDGYCIRGFEKCNQVADCSNGEDELNCPCQPDYFQCRDGSCVLQNLYCNGVPDCNDNSDEEYCINNITITNNSECAQDQFKCRDGSCVLQNLRCNGAFDCPDQSDEANCFKNGTQACSPSQWQCDDGMCLDVSVRCNQRVDCPRDNSDERNCPEYSNRIQCTASEFQCRNGICIDQRRKCDHQADCTDNSDEQSCPCTEKDFKCGNGYCIAMDKRCNSLNDCQDGSDELHCNIVCGPEESKCRNGECIPKNKLCNIVRDCSDGSDEDNCAICRADQFRCRDGLCLTINLICNGHHECAGGEDERNCGNINPVICRDSEFKCNDLTCIPFSKRCNGVPDCPDQSDEEANICDFGLAPCPSSDFTCFDGSCISKDKQCNGRPDCPESSDEIGCSPDGNTNNTLHCMSSEFRCNDGKSCIRGSFRCDSVKDCEDNSDEEDCPDKPTCSPSETTCSDGSCIPRYLECNGARDCKDGSDEQNCPSRRTCSSDEITCGDGSCVPKDRECDGRRDCPDGYDEQNCQVTCSPLEFLCDGGRCIPLNRKCDGYPDCSDNTDEINCSSCRSDQFRCRDGRCILAQQRCDRRIDCRDRSDEENCQVQCSSLEFRCSSGECIPNHQRCDRQYHCADGSDEIQCEGYLENPTTISPVPSNRVRCDSNQFSCHSGDQCVPQYAHCDQNRDCSDASDEYNCASTPDLLLLKTYPTDQIIKESREVVFQCRDEGPLRANVRWVRDRGQQLPPGSRDLRGRLEMPNIKLEHSGKYTCEAVGYPESTPGSRVSVELVVEPFVQPTIRPPKACGYNEATCSNGDCIAKSQVCDDHYDCIDGSDELRCNRHGCEPNQFRCDNSRCVQKTWRCDSDDDCGDGSDERNCGTSAPGSQCRYDEFMCNRGNQCIPKAFHCDLEVDCIDRSDELGCSKVTIQTPPPPMVVLRPGDLFTLTCTAVGIPTPEVIWRLNWGHIPEKCNTTSVNGVGFLSCPNIQEADQGAYSCEAMNSRGSVFAIPDTILVVKPPTTPCPRGQFNELATRSEDCIKCFCFGVTTECKSANLFTFQLPPPLEAYRVVNVYVSPSGSVEIRREDSQYQPSIRPLAAGFQISTTNNDLSSYNQPIYPYFALPENYYGNQLKTYGGYLKYNVNFEGSGASLDIPDIILTGNGYTLYYKGYPLTEGTNNNVVIQFFPTNWYKVTSSGRPGGDIPSTSRSVEQASREDLMMALEKVDNILIKTQYQTNGLETTLTDINMDSAGYRNAGQGKAAFVEECSCPPGYTGLSCEKCSSGYLHQPSGPWLGRCYTGGTPNRTCEAGTYGDPARGIPCEPCPCPLTTPSNQFARTCSLGSDGNVNCNCPPGYQGRQCETCARGYTGNPLVPGDSCRRVGSCDPAGSVSTEPDASGRCICKSYATGSTCNQCKPNTFNLATTNDFGCVSCFCMGINTTCGSSNLYRSQITAAFTRTTQDFQLVLSNRLNQPFSDNIEVNPTEREIIYQGFLPEVYYWVLPSRFLYNKVTSYGGNLKYTLRYVPTPGGQSSRNNAPDVEIASVNGVRLSYFHNEQLEPNRPVTVSVPLLEQYWQRADGQRANREHLLMTLAELENIYIKATYTTNTQEAGLISVSLDIAEDRNTGQERAVEVEQCDCPAGYRGTSCEECEAGYTRVEEGLYLGICELCNCNGHSTQCDPELGVCMNCGDNTEGDQCDVCQPGFVGNPLNGGKCSRETEACNCDHRGSVSSDCRNNQCTCKTNVEGPQCDRCREGTFDLSESHIEGCLECVCSGVAHTCQPSNLYRDQIPMQIIDGSQTFTLTDINRQDIIRDNFLLNVSKNEIGFDFNNQRGQRLFWSLPSEFTGNKITSYGGNLIFTQHYTSLPNVSPSYDTDVVIVGSGITLYWTSEEVLNANETRTTTIPLIERYWRRADVQRTASRADMLNALSDINAILIRASHSTHTIFSYLSDVTLDTTVTWRNGQPVATSVEVCRCPPGYKGTSCETCASGFYKDYDRTCKRCPCNNNEEYCELGSNSQVVCHCKATYAGPNCGNTDIGGPSYPTREPSPPTISISLSEPTIRIVEAGSSVRYTCTGRSLVSRGPITVKWSKEGGPLPDRAIDDNHGILIITSVRVSDSGTYICSASDGYNLVTERATLTVGGGQSTPPRVTIEPPYLQVREGQPIEFRCSSSGVPTPNLHWEKSGQDNRLNPQSSFSNGVFRIPYVTKSDEAHYRCLATNPSGSSYETVTLHVIESTQEPATSAPEPSVALTVEPPDYSGRPGDTVRLRCVSSTNRNIRYRWSRLQQVPLPTSSTASDDGILTIYNVSPSDSGIYVCIAISVTTGQEESEVQARINIIDDSQRPVSIRIEPDRQTVLQGATAELRCIPGSQGNIQWSKAGESELPSNIQVNGPILRISNIRVEDEGVYICVVQGPERSPRASAIIKVERREPPSISLFPRDTQTVTEGSSLLFQCRLTGGIPLPTIRWSRPDNKPYPTRNSKEQQGGILRFDSVTREEEGQYMCTAENPAGSRTMIATLEVQTYPVVSIFPPNPVTVSSGQRVRLECRATGYPQPTVFWSRHQTGVNFYNPQEITAKTPQTAIYEITSANEADNGRYTCTAQNAAGANEEMIEVIVNGDFTTSAPGRGDIPIGSNTYGTSPAIEVDDAFTAPHNGSVEMRCAIRGLTNKEIYLKWVRSDGIPLPSRHILHDGTLHINQLQYSDAGAYVCQGIGRDGSIYFQATTNLKVTAGLQIRLDPTRQVVKPGDNAEIRCTVTGEEPIDITWVAVGRDLPRSVTTRGGLIRFQNIKNSDAGRYMCRARDNYGHIAESNSDVIVDDHNRVTAVERNQKAYEGSSARLRCDTDSSQQIYWTRDAKPLPYNSVVQGSNLRLDNIKPEDAGRYFCHINTTNGQITDYIDLQVEPTGCRQQEFRCGNGQCIPLDLTCDGHLHCQDGTDEINCGGRQGRGLETTLELTIGPSKEIVNFGDSVDVRCFAKGAPSTRVYWAKLYNDMAYNERTYGDMLRIDNANSENSGTFRCTAQSPSGSIVEKDYVLNIEDKPHHDASAVEVLSVNYGDTMPLECKTDLEPPVTYTWSKQGSVLPSNAVSKGVLLNISSISYQDAGFYICSANNSNVRMDIPRLLVVKGAVPFFSQAPSSYLSLPTLPNAYLFFEIEISFKPQRPDGLILYNGQQGGTGDFISFGLRNGYPEFRFDMGSGPAIITGNAPLSLGEWHTVKLTRSKKDGSMYVDGQGPFQGVGPKRHQGLDLNQPLFVGGVPDFSRIHKLNGFETGFVGCVSRLVIGKTEHDLMKDALVKNLVTSCETCAVNPCLNNGACQEAPTAQGFTCICPRGFSGDTCNKIGEPCYPGACGKGRCVNGEEGIECYCPLYKGGNRCTRDVAITIPAFTSNGYLAYPTPKSHLKSKFTIKFKANDTSDGILLYSAQNGDGQGDFVSLAIRDRRLEFRFDTGSGVVELKNHRDIPTGQWLTVYAERSSREGRLAVSGELAGSITLPGVSKGLDLRTPLYVGGYDKEQVQIARSVGVSRGFSGCISEVDVSGSSLTLTSVTDASNVGECLDSQGTIGDPCKNNPCLHNGICYPLADGRNFDCVCQTGYSGTICEIEQDMCAALNPCENGGSCIGTPNSYKCNCLMGYSGPNCQQKSELRTEASFQGDGYIELSSDYLPHLDANEEELIIVDFSTSQSNGLIFWHGQPPDTDGKGQDYVSLAVVNGYLEFSYELGSDPANIRVTEQRVDDGKKHRATIKRQAKDGSLELDQDGGRSFGASPGLLTQLNTKGNIYIGGLPNIDLMTGGRYSQSFQGCIHSLQIQQSGVINFAEKAVSATNVLPCSSTNIDDYDVDEFDETVN